METSPAAQKEIEELIEAKEGFKEAVKLTEEIAQAINIAPEAVTSDQIGLIVDRTRLEKEKQGKDPALVEDINEQIKEINDKIKNSKVRLNKAKIYERITDNGMKLTGELGIPIVEGRTFEEVNAFIEKENERIRKQNKENGLKKGDKDYVEPLALQSKNDKNNSAGFASYDAKGNVTHIFINKAAAEAGSNFTVAQHELLHGVLAATIKKNLKAGLKSEAIPGMAKALRIFMAGNPQANNYIEARLKSYEDKGQSVKDEELLTIMSDAITKGYFKYDESFVGTIGGGLRSIAREFGWNFEIRDGRDVFRFIKDYNKEVYRGRFSKGMKKIALEGFENKTMENLETEVAERSESRTQMDSKNASETQIYQRVDKMYTDNKSKWDNPNAKKRIAQEMAYEFDENVVDRLKNLKGFDSEDKRDIALNFILSEKRGLTGLIEGFDPNKMINKETGKPYESISAYVLQILPSGKSLLDSRLIEFYEKDPKYNNIMQSLSDEAIAKKAEKELKDGIQGTRDEKEAIRFKIADRLGPDAKVIVENLKTIMTDSDGNLKPEYRGKSIKELRGVVLPQVQEMFGIKPKPGNLTATDVKNAQFFIQKHAAELWLMLPEGYTQGGTSTGVTSVLMTEQRTKKNNLKEVQDVFYTKSVVAKVSTVEGEQVVEEKAKRPKNLEVQKKMPNVSMPDFKAVFGITERGEKNFYKKEDNTSSRIRAIVSETERMIVNQVAREIDPYQFALADGLSKVMYSNAFNTADIEYGDGTQKAILMGINELDYLLNAIDISNEEEINRVLDIAFENLPKKFDRKTFKKQLGLNKGGAINGAINRYKKQVIAFEGSKKELGFSLVDKIRKTLLEGKENFENKNLAKILGIKSVTLKNDEVVNKDWKQGLLSDEDIVNTARKDITAQIARRRNSTMGILT